MALRPPLLGDDRRVGGRVDELPAVYLSRIDAVRLALPIAVELSKSVAISRPPARVTRSAAMTPSRRLRLNRLTLQTRIPPPSPSSTLRTSRPSTPVRSVAGLRPTPTRVRSPRARRRLPRP